MRVYRRKLAAGRLTDTYYVEYRQAGKHIIKALGTTVKADALRMARELVQPMRQETSAKALVERHRELLQGGERIPLTEAFDRYVRAPHRKHISARIILAKRQRWADFVAYLHAEQGLAPTATLRDVKSAQVDAYIGRLQITGPFLRDIVFRRQNAHDDTSYQRPAAPLSPRTVRGYFVDVRGVFSALSGAASLDALPFDSGKLPELKMTTRSYFTKEELDLIADKTEVADPFVYALTMVGVNTGLRAADLCTLRWAEVDLASDLITRQTGKTGTTVQIPILPALRDFLASLPRVNEFVLPEHAARYKRNPMGVFYRFQKCVEALGIATKSSGKGCRAVGVKGVHALRHTFAAACARARIPLPVVQHVLGHTNAAVTEIYTKHMQVADAKRHMQDLPDFFPRRKAAQIIAATPASLPQVPPGNALTAALAAPTSAVDPLARIRARLAAGGPLKALVADIAKLVEIDHED